MELIVDIKYNPTIEELQALKKTDEILKDICEQVGGECQNCPFNFKTGKCLQIEFDDKVIRKID